MHTFQKYQMLDFRKESISYVLITCRKSDDSCHEKRLSFKVEKLQVGDYYHKKKEACDMKSVSGMKAAQANKLISSVRGSIISRR
jgi:hypothetical protein